MGSMNKFPVMMSLASKELELSLQKVRAGVNHNLSTGQSLEEAVRVFLRKHLPTNVSVAQGQIIDSTGAISKQLDVILYDPQATPILYTSEEEGHRLVPVEGVLGVVEVKTNLTASMIPGIIENMQSVKNMQKTAYHRPLTPPFISETYNMYGQELDSFPVIYSLFAFESSSFENLIPDFRLLNDTLAPSDRIDHACLLDKGVIGNRTPQGQLDAIPSPDTHSTGLNTEHALLTWYLFIQRLYSQAKSKPISMHSYLGDGFYF